jgi:hypothetical protein
MIRRTVRRAAATLAAGTVMAACTPAIVATPEALDPAAIPSGSIQPEGAPATGPIVELGSGRLIDRGWRYSTYPSEDGRCMQLELAGVTSTGCGDPLPAAGEVFGGIGHGEVGGVTAIEGVAAEEVATVWIVLESGLRVPAALLPLDEAELDGSAFLALIPAGESVTHVQAVALNGEVLDTIDLR